MGKLNEKIELLRQYYLKNLVEDPMDGTDFDCLVLDMLDSLETQVSTMENESLMTEEQVIARFLKCGGTAPLQVALGFGWRAYEDLDEHLQKPWVIKTIPMEEKEEKNGPAGLD